MRRIMALAVAVMMLCCSCGGMDRGVPPPVSDGVGAESWSGWAGERLELQRRLVRWYGFNLQSDHPEPGFRESYRSILAGPGGVMGWVEFPQGSTLPLFHEGCTGEGFLHQKDTPFPTGEGGRSVLWLSSRRQSQWERWLAPEAGQVFRVHILDLTVTYRIHSVEYGGSIPAPEPSDNQCVLIFPRTGGDLRVLGIREEP